MAVSVCTELPMSVQERASGTPSSFGARHASFMGLLAAIALVGTVAPADAAEAAGAPGTNAQQGTAQPFTVEDLVRLKRVSDPQVSPDGRYVAYVVRETDIEANRGRSDI